MKVKNVPTLTKRKGADALVLPFFEGQKPAFASKPLETLVRPVLKAGDFKGKKGELICHYPPKGEKRLILIGLGQEKDLSEETLRRAYASAARSVKERVKSVNVALPQPGTLDSKQVTAAAVEGVLLANYVFDVNKSQKDKALGSITMVGADTKALKKAEKICHGVFLTRDLVIENADRVTPEYLAKMAKELSKEFPKVKTKVLGLAQIKKEKMGLIEAVSRSSANEPRVIIMEYRGAPKSKQVYAIVGKGVTYDTGGLNLKPTGFMESMREDMSGAGAIIGTMRAIADLGLPINVIAAIGSTENAIGPTSYKPGDVYKSHSGITVEVSNTDAEGRLVLADVLSYVQKEYKPTHIIDMATLTGGVVVALGEEVSGVMSNDADFARSLKKSGVATYERLCYLPLYEEYEAILSSKFADIKNSGPRKASPIQGGIFLKKFIKGPKWAHIDIAGTAFPDTLKSYHPVQATGVGVRLLTHFLETECG